MRAMVKYKEKYLCLKEQYSEYSDTILDLLSDNKRYESEVHYMESFIEWKNLMDEYIHFKKNASEKYDEDLPFPKLTL